MKRLEERLDEINKKYDINTRKTIQFHIDKLMLLNQNLSYKQLNFQINKINEIESGIESDKLSAEDVISKLEELIDHKYES